MVKHAQNPRPSNSSDNPHRATKGKGGLRSKSTIMRLNMYKVINFKLYTLHFNFNLIYFLDSVVIQSAIKMAR